MDMCRGGNSDRNWWVNAEVGTAKAWIPAGRLMDRFTEKGHKKSLRLVRGKSKNRIDVHY